MIVIPLCGRCCLPSNASTGTGIARSRAPSALAVRRRCSSSNRTASVASPRSTASTNRAVFTAHIAIVVETDRPRPASIQLGGVAERRGPWCAACCWGSRRSALDGIANAQASIPLSSAQARRRSPSACDRARGGRRRSRSPTRCRRARSTSAATRPSSSHRAVVRSSRSSSDSGVTRKPCCGSAARDPARPAGAGPRGRRWCCSRSAR